VRVEYDPDVDAAYIYLTEIKPGGVATTVPGWPNTQAFEINLDFDADGRLLGIEVLDASKRLPIDFLRDFANPS
jgi:uncharacterized protein YuzE